MTFSSRWTWNSINLWVSSQDIDRDIRIAELLVLNATETVYQFFGTGSKTYHIKGMVVGDSDRNSLDADAIANTARTFVTPYASIANMKIKAIKFTNSPHTSLRIGDVVYNTDSTPFYDFEATLVTST